MCRTPEADGGVGPDSVGWLRLSVCQGLLVKSCFGDRGWIRRQYHVYVAWADARIRQEPGMTPLMAGAEPEAGASHRRPAAGVHQGSPIEERLRAD